MGEVSWANEGGAGIVAATRRAMRTVVRNSRELAAANAPAFSSALVFFDIAHGNVPTLGRPQLVKTGSCYYTTLQNRKGGDPQELDPPPLDLALLLNPDRSHTRIPRRQSRPWRHPHPRPSTTYSAPASTPFVLATIISVSTPRPPKSRRRCRPCAVLL